MRAAVLTKPGLSELREVPVLSCGPDDVLIKFAWVRICGTDLQIFHGHYAADRLPLVPGHELSGKVAKIGDRVSSIRVGARVIADITVGCGHCFYYRKNEC